MTVRVYIAASSREVERVRAAQAAVAARGWELTLDWLTPMLALIADGKTDATLSEEEAADHATRDLRAIDDADAVWYLIPREPTKGAYVEFGYALGTGTLIVASGAPRTSIFEAMADAHVRDEDACDAIATLRALLLIGSPR